MIMNFFKKILWSIYSPSFYSEVLTSGRGKAFGYFFMLIAILSVITAIFPIYTIAASLQPEMKRMLAKASTLYPKELEVKIKNGIVATNVEEPYFIKTPTEEKDQNVESNFIVIDTKTPFSVSQFDSYKAFVWVSKDAVYARSQQNELKVYSLSKVDELTINKSVVDGLIAKVSPWLVVVVPVLSVLIIIGLFIGYVFRLLYLFFLALCIFLLAKVMRRPISYGQSYTVGLYAMTLSFIIGILQFFIKELHIPFLFTIVALVIVAINLRSAPAKTPAKSRNKR